jgi:uncharacterized damage-inducible protein DinB
MNETDRILDQMDRAYSGDAWHGPPLMQVLAGVSADDASAHPIPGAHSIWEIVQHLTSWKAISQRRLFGEPIRVPTELDWPPVRETSDAAWQRALEKLSENHAGLRNVTARFSEDQLQGKAAGPDYTCYQVLHGMIQHDLYHAGQIAILKKALVR